MANLTVQSYVSDAMAFNIAGSFLRDDLLVFTEVKLFKKQLELIMFFSFLLLFKKV